MNLKLRNRIAFYYLTATAIITALLFVIIFAVTRRTVFNYLDNQLNIESQEVTNGLLIEKDRVTIVNPYEWEEREHSQVEVNPAFIEISDKNGILIRKTDNLLDQDLEFIPSATEKIYFNSNLSGKPIRQVQVPLIAPDGSIAAYMIIAVPMEEAVLIMEKLGTVLIIGFLGALLLLFFVTRWTAGKSIIPIHKVTSTAEKITKENLGDRIELPQNKDEIYTLTSTINGLLDRLEDAVLREKQFTSDASHELRTPLSVIKGTLEVLIRKPRDVEHYENKISYCISEVDRMTGIIDQLLLLARFESGKVEPMTREIDLSESIRYAILRLESPAKEKGVNINFKADKKYAVKADSSMLDVILENLLSNSIKYSNGSRSIDVFIEMKNGRTSCSIRDYGIGMEKRDIEKIFDRFFRSDEARNTHHAGDGIGMAIVKRLADIQNLTISYASEPSKGTTVTITFN